VRTAGSSTCTMCPPSGTGATSMVPPYETTMLRQTARASALSVARLLQRHLVADGRARFGVGVDVLEQLHHGALLGAVDADPGSRAR
jgi:hypothetical protein